MTEPTNAQTFAATYIGRQIANQARDIANGSRWTRARRVAPVSLASVATGLFIADPTRWWLLPAVLVLLTWWVLERRAWVRRYVREANRLRVEKLGPDREAGDA